MHRIDTPSASANANGTGRAGFTDGDPGTTPRTIVDDDWLNAVQEEPATVIERSGQTLIKVNKSQLWNAIELPRLFGAFSGLVAAGATYTAATGIAIISRPNRYLNAYHAGTAGGGQNSDINYATVKTNSFFVNGNSAGAATGAFTSVAGYQSIADSNNYQIFVAVSSAGVWYRARAAGGGNASYTGNGTIGGGPNLQKIVWDAVNARWWAVGPGGIWRAPDADTLTWTQISATQHDNVCPLPSGRVLFYRPSDTRIYYTTDLTALVGGATVTVGANGWIWDSYSQVSVFASGFSADGTASTAISTAPASPAGNAALSVFRFRGRAFFVSYNGGAAAIIGTYVTPTVGLTGADYVFTARNASAAPLVVGCGDRVLLSTSGIGGGVSGDVLISPVVFDFTGLLA